MRDNAAYVYSALRETRWADAAKLVIVTGGGTALAPLNRALWQPLSPLRVDSWADFTARLPEGVVSGWWGEQSTAGGWAVSHARAHAPHVLLPLPALLAARHPSPPPRRALPRRLSERSPASCRPRLRAKSCAASGTCWCAGPLIWGLPRCACTRTGCRLHSTTAACRPPSALSRRTRPSTRRRSRRRSTSSRSRRSSRQRRCRGRGRRRRCCCHVGQATSRRCGSWGARASVGTVEMCI